MKIKKNDQASNIPDAAKTGEIIRTPRGSFTVTSLNREEMGSLGYSYHHHSDDGQLLIMTNVQRAFAVCSQQI